MKPETDEALSDRLGIDCRVYSLAHLIVAKRYGTWGKAAPCDVEAADRAEGELKALLEDRASLDAMTTLLAKARSERDKLRYAAQLAADWINGNSLDSIESTDDTVTFSDDTVAVAKAQGDAIKQALLDALK